MTNVSLLPCPFCGDHAAPNLDGDIECAKCCAIGPLGGESRAAAWNTRAAQQDASEIASLKHDIERHVQIAADLAAEVELYRDALIKIRDDHYPRADLEIRDCKHPEMIWQSVARRALEQ